MQNRLVKQFKNFIFNSKHYIKENKKFIKLNQYIQEHKPLFKMHQEDQKIFEKYKSQNSPNQESTSSPQAIQGMWQAYGQMRAARTTARGAIISSGFITGAVWIYQKRKENELKEKNRELKKKDDVLKNKDDELKKKDDALKNKDSKLKEEEESLKKEKIGLRSVDSFQEKLINKSLLPLYKSHKMLEYENTKTKLIIKDVLCEKDKQCINKYTSKIKELKKDFENDAAKDVSEFSKKLKEWEFKEKNSISSSENSNKEMSHTTNNNQYRR